MKALGRFLLWTLVSFAIIGGFALAIKFLGDWGILLVFVPIVAGGAMMIRESRSNYDPWRRPPE